MIGDTSRGLRTNSRLTDRVRLAVGILLSALVFYPSLVENLVPLRVLALVLGVLALASELWFSDRPARRRLLLIACATAGAIALVGSIELIARGLDDRMFAVNAEHIFVLFPLYALFAALSYRHGGARAHAMGYLVVGSVTAVLAIVESLLTVSLLGRGMEFLTSQREGTTRALVGAEHVLVLGALLAVAVTLTPIISRRWQRLTITILLIAGCWATGSRAAAVLCVAVAILQGIPVVTRWLQRFWWTVAIAAGVAFLTLASLSAFVWTSFIAGATGIEYSANYRFASYAVLVDVLRERPFGYLLGSVPTGEWMMGSELRGPVDLARSADSELVFAVFAAGWLGVIVYLAIFMVGILALRRSPTIGFATLLLTSLGFIMSLHGWDAASMVWYALIGASTAAAVVTRRRKRTESATITLDPSRDGAKAE